MPARDQQQEHSHHQARWCTLPSSHHSRGPGPALCLLTPSSQCTGTAPTAPALRVACRDKIGPSPRPPGLTWALGSCPPARQVRGFYRGLSLPVCTVSLVSSLSFGTYRHCLAHLCRFRYGSADAKPGRTDITLSGFASGLVRVSGVDEGSLGLQGRAEAAWRLGDCG